jgi:hypothetical protein
LNRFNRLAGVLDRTFREIFFCCVRRCTTQVPHPQEGGVPDASTTPGDGTVPAGSYNPSVIDIRPSEVAVSSGVVNVLSTQEGLENVTAAGSSIAPLDAAQGEGERADPIAEEKKPQAKGPKQIIAVPRDSAFIPAVPAADQFGLPNSYRGRYLQVQPSNVGDARDASSTPSGRSHSCPDLGSLFSNDTFGGRVSLLPQDPSSFSQDESSPAAQLPWRETLLSLRPLPSDFPSTPPSQGTPSPSPQIISEADEMSAAQIIPEQGQITPLRTSVVDAGGLANSVTVTTTTPQLDLSMIQPSRPGLDDRMGISQRRRSLSHPLPYTATADRNRPARPIGPRAPGSTAR